jgi:hypothetical protein
LRSDLFGVYGAGFGVHYRYQLSRLRAGLIYRVAELMVTVRKATLALAFP